VRILNAVENEQEGRFVEGVENVVEGHVSLRRVDGGDHSLVAGARRHCLQACAVHRQHAHRGELSVANQIAQAGVMARRVDVDFTYRTGVVTQFGERRMKTEDQA